MIINADSLVPHIKAKMRLTQTDASRHYICPDCRVRTRLNTLGDGRKKCTACGKKFQVLTRTDAKKIQQCADILLCFCLDFSAQRTAQITHYRYRLVAQYYNSLRTLFLETGTTDDRWKEKNKDNHPHLLARMLIELMPEHFITTLEPSLSSKA